MEPPHLYLKNGREEGIPEKVLGRAVRRTSLISSKGSTPVLSLKHLSVMTGAPHLYLRRVVAREVDPYMEIVRHKSNGGKRFISAPEPILRSVQRWILSNCFGHLKPHGASYAYEANKSAVTCATQHIGARWMVKIDLSDFFGSINEAAVYKVFLDGGYSELVSFEMARLCTRVDGTLHPRERAIEKYTEITPYAVDARGYLPQGAPTSGMLANLVFASLDETLLNHGIERGLTYTRYSDDLVFSTASAWDRKRSSEVIQLVQKEVSRQGFFLNPIKTRVVTPGSRHIVLGILVEHDRLRLLPEVRKRILNHIRGVDVFGLRAHVDSRNFRSVFSFINFVEGHVAYAQAIDEDWAVDVRVIWRQALAKSGFPIG